MFATFLRILSGMLAILFVWADLNVIAVDPGPTIALYVGGVLFASFAIFGGTAANRIEAMLFASLPDDSSQRQRHAVRLRFAIRDLLWLTVVVALAVGWLMSYVERNEREIRHLRAARDQALQNWQAAQSDGRANETQARQTYFLFRDLLIKAIE